MKLEEALKQGNNRARRIIWAESNCYLKRLPGTPISQLWSRRTQKIIECETPQVMILFTDNNEDWEPFTGEIDKEDIELTDDLSAVFKRRLNELKVNEKQN